MFDDKIAEMEGLLQQIKDSPELRERVGFLGDILEQVIFESSALITKY